MKTLLMKKTGTALSWLFLTLLLLASSGTAQAASRAEVANRLEAYRQYFVDFQFAPDKAVPGELLADCYGVMIIRQYKAGFVIGAKGGDGVILMHDRASGEWSPPAFIRMAEGSFGFQIGGQAIDAIILIMNQAGVDMLLKTRFKIGVDAAAAAGPVGRDVSASVGPGTALLTYSRAKGLYAGASFEGGAMFNHDSYNQALYGMPVGIRDILIDRRVGMPPEAYAIVDTLKNYAVRNVAGPEPYPEGRRQPPIPPAAPPQPYGSDYDPYTPPVTGGYQGDVYGPAAGIGVGPGVGAGPVPGGQVGGEGVADYLNYGVAPHYGTSSQVGESPAYGDPYAGSGSPRRNPVVTGAPPPPSSPPPSKYDMIEPEPTFPSPFTNPPAQGSAAPNQAELDRRAREATDAANEAIRAAHEAKAAADAAAAAAAAARQGTAGY